MDRLVPGLDRPKLGVLEAKIDFIVGLEQRVVQLEAFKNKALGLAAAVSFASSLIFLALQRLLQTAPLP